MTIQQARRRLTGSRHVGGILGLEAILAAAGCDEGPSSPSIETVAPRNLFIESAGPEQENPACDHE